MHWFLSKVYAILHFKGKMHTTAAAAATLERKIPQIERKVGAVFLFQVLRSVLSDVQI